jgi:hypothetical protein
MRSQLVHFTVFNFVQQGTKYALNQRFIAAMHGIWIAAQTTKFNVLSNEL